MNRILLASGIACASALLPFSVEATTFSSLTIFGDSLMDTGNLYNITDPFGFGIGIPPSPPYNQRNVNDLLWIDMVQQELGLSPVLLTELIVNPDPRRAAEGINFASAGALSSDVHVADDQIPLLDPFLLGLQEQIDLFSLFTTVRPADPTGLYAVWAGANDYTDFFFDPTSAGGLSPAELPAAVTDNVVGSVVELAQLGAKYILVPNLPSLGLLPFADFLNPLDPQQDIPALLSQLSAAHNQLLAAKLAAVEAQFDGLNVIELDIESLFASAIANPADFGFTNVDTPCLINFQPGFQFDGVCDNPDEFLFWDDVHPTSAAHAKVAELALATLMTEKSDGAIDPVLGVEMGANNGAAAPEPGVLWGALVAFGLVGLGRRRQSASSAKAAA
ncbi:MAG: SGNH/GDSL hydrolase family protein [Cyanobacteria bacterium P01_D01_bin.14]